MVAFEVSTNPSRAREILEKKIEAGRTSAMALFHHIHTQTPVDTIAKGKALRFGTRPSETSAPELVMAYGDKGASVHKHALSQLATRANVPPAYLTGLAHGAEWERKLAAGILNEHYHSGESDTRYLLRAVDGQVRGFLSDRYRRIDNRPLTEAIAEEAEKIGAVPVDGTYSETRVALKILLPQIYEPVPGEVIAFGFEWGNSDYGAARNSGRAFILRVWCLNGATMENTLSQVHLGGRLSDDIELSKRTYDLDTRASVSAMKDVIRGSLTPRKIEALCAGIQRANENKVEWKNVKSALAKKLLKGELESARQAFEGEDVYNLPAERTMWRVSNAVSWIAGQKEVDTDRRLELQRLAGELIDGRADRAERNAA